MFPAFHLMLHPTLGVCSPDGLPSRQHGVAGCPQVPAGHRRLQGRPRVVELAAVDQLAVPVEEEEVRRARRLVRLRHLLRLVEEVGERVAPALHLLGHLRRGVVGVVGHVVGHDRPPSARPLSWYSRAEARQLVGDVLHEGTVVGQEDHQQRRRAGDSPTSDTVFPVAGSGREKSGAARPRGIIVDGVWTMVAPEVSRDYGPMQPTLNVANAEPRAPCPRSAELALRTRVAGTMRIVSLACSNTEIVHALGCAAMLVGVDDHSDWPEEVVGPLPRLGPDLDIDVDAVAALQPGSGPGDPHRARPREGGGASGGGGPPLRRSGARLPRGRVPGHPGHRRAASAFRSGPRSRRRRHARGAGRPEPADRRSEDPGAVVAQAGDHARGGARGPPTCCTRRALAASSRTRT